MPDVADAFLSLTLLADRDDNVIPQGGFVKPMGSIRERARKDGSIGYTAQIIIKRKGKPTHREAATFDRRTSALAWLRNREAELNEPGGIERARVKGLTVGDAIDRYITDSVRDLGRTKEQVLKAIKGYDLAKIEAADVGPEDIVRFARELTATGIKPQTVNNYLSHLSAVFAVAKPGWGIPLDRQAMRDAFGVAKRLGLTGKSEKRERRPTIAEINRLMDYFAGQEKRNPGMVPMTRVVPFALFSTRRLGEICRIDWRDWDAPGSRILVRDMKHPGEKIGNDQWCDVPSEAIGFMGELQTAGRIFPYSEDAVGANFTRACQFLEIDDLHFHDLRHEGISRLFEMGWTIPRAATVSGHRSWQSLQRYSHLRQTGDKWAGWKWLPVLTMKERGDAKSQRVGR
jgi:integrase